MIGDGWVGPGEQGGDMRIQTMLGTRAFPAWAAVVTVLVLALAGARTAGTAVFAAGDVAGPVVTGLADVTVNEGPPATTFALGSFTDSGTGPWTGKVDWGDGRVTTVAAIAGPGSLGTMGHSY